MAFTCDTSFKGLDRTFDFTCDDKFFNSILFDTLIKLNFFFVFFSLQKKIDLNLEVNPNRILTNLDNRLTLKMTDYQPLVQYQQNKDFVGLMTTLMDVVEKLQERNNLSDGEYLDMANLCKSLYEAKTKVEKHIVFVDMVRRAKKNPPKPPREVDKLNDPDFLVCEFCDKSLHKKYLATHQAESKTCLRHRQAKQSCVVEKLPLTDNFLKEGKLKHQTVQAFNLQLAHRNKNGEPEPKRNEQGAYINIRAVIAGSDNELFDNMPLNDLAMRMANTRARERGDIGGKWMCEDGSWGMVGNPPKFPNLDFHSKQRAVPEGTEIGYPKELEWKTKIYVLIEMSMKPKGMTKKFWKQQGVDLRKAYKAKEIAEFRYEDCEKKLKEIADRLGFNK